MSSLNMSQSTLSQEYDGLVIKDISDPHDHDILCGRGGASYKHPGNRTYRQLITLNKPLYVTCKKSEKIKISRGIVTAIRGQDPPGRFLERNNATNLFYDIGDKKAVEKTSQALREGQPKILENMNKLKTQLSNLAPASLSGDESSRSTDVSMRFKKELTSLDEIKAEIQTCSIDSEKLQIMMRSSIQSITRSTETSTISDLTKSIDFEAILSPRTSSSSELLPRDSTRTVEKLSIPEDTIDLSHIAERPSLLSRMVPEDSVDLSHIAERPSILERDFDMSESHDLFQSQSMDMRTSMASIVAPLRNPLQQTIPEITPSALPSKARSQKNDEPFNTIIEQTPSNASMTSSRKSSIKLENLSTNTRQQLSAFDDNSEKDLENIQSVGSFSICGITVSTSAETASRRMSYDTELYGGLNASMASLGLNTSMATLGDVDLPSDVANAIAGGPTTRVSFGSRVGGGSSTSYGSGRRRRSLTLKPESSKDSEPRPRSSNATINSAVMGESHRSLMSQFSGFGDGKVVFEESEHNANDPVMVWDAANRDSPEAAGNVGRGSEQLLTTTESTKDMGYLNDMKDQHPSLTKFLSGLTAETRTSETKAVEGRVESNDTTVSSGRSLLSEFGKGGNSSSNRSWFSTRQSRSARSLMSDCSAIDDGEIENLMDLA